MGIAILIEDADFSKNNIGTVTPINGNFDCVLDFIATKSTNYLDTGIVFSNIESVDVTFWLNDASQESYILGNADTNRVSNQINIYNNRIYCLTEFQKPGDTEGSGEWYQSGQILESKTFYHTEYLKQQYLKVDNVSIPLISGGNSVGQLNQTVYMFNSNKSDGSYEDKSGLIGIKNLTFSDSLNQTIFNAVPVLKNNIPYYYDTVSNQLLSINGNNEIWYKTTNSETLIQYQ